MKDTGYLRKERGSENVRYLLVPGTLNMPPSIPITTDYLSLHQFLIYVPSNTTLLQNPTLFVGRYSTLSVAQITRSTIVFDTYQVITKVC